MTENLSPDWKRLLHIELNKPYFSSLLLSVKQAYATKTVYPPAPLVFQAFQLCPFALTKVVILGQDPYHGENQAHGLAFSVPKNTKLPPSLRNIYKELTDDLNTPFRQVGNLENWAKQGVLLLNATLTVLPNQPGSHQKLGWETFTDAVIKLISDQKENVVFILWGKYAQAKASLIDENKHLVLIAPHPSPFSAHTGFFGCRHFSKTNEYLKQHHQTPIDW